MNKLVCVLVCANAQDGGLYVDDQGLLLKTARSTNTQGLTVQSTSVLYENANVVKVVVCCAPAGG